MFPSIFKRTKFKRGFMCYVLSTECMAVRTSLSQFFSSRVKILFCFLSKHSIDQISHHTSVCRVCIRIKKCRLTLQRKMFWIEKRGVVLLLVIFSVHTSCISGVHRNYH